MKLYRLAFALCVISVAMLTAGCSSTENKAENGTPEKPASGAPPQSKEPVLYTGQEAFNRMMGLALKWSPDAQPARLESVLTTETTGQKGKSPFGVDSLPRPAAGPSRPSFAREAVGRMRRLSEFQPRAMKAPTTPTPPILPFYRCC